MSMENGLPQDGQVRVNLAVQVAGIAAQVSTALRSGDADMCGELEAKLGRARDQMQRGAAPGGMVPFLDVMCGLLRGDDVPIDDKKVLAEAGDVLWNLTMILEDRGFTLQQAAYYNVAKLEDRAKRGVIRGSGDNR